MSKTEDKSFPIIKAQEDHFEIKSESYLAFRKFSYSEIENIKLYNPNHVWWVKLFVIRSTPFARKFSKNDPWFLTIKSNKNGEWKYAIPQSQIKFTRQKLSPIRKRISELRRQSN